MTARKKVCQRERKQVQSIHSKTHHQSKICQWCYCDPHLRICWNIPDCKYGIHCSWRSYPLEKNLQAAWAGGPSIKTRPHIAGMGRHVKSIQIPFLNLFLMTFQNTDAYTWLQRQTCRNPSQSPNWWIMAWDDYTRSQGSRGMLRMLPHPR